jgi:hydroxypyruvate isomerase
MLRFAANLTMMYNEVPFLERFAAAAADGFDAVEYLFPYDFAPEDIASRTMASSRPCSICRPAIGPLASAACPACPIAEKSSSAPSTPHWSMRGPPG